MLELQKLNDGGALCSHSWSLLPLNFQPLSSASPSCDRTRHRSAGAIGARAHHSVLRRAPSSANLCVQWPSSTCPPRFSVLSRPVVCTPHALHARLDPIELPGLFVYSPQTCTIGSGNRKDEPVTPTTGAERARVHAGDPYEENDWSLGALLQLQYYLTIMPRDSARWTEGLGGRQSLLVATMRLLHALVSTGSFVL